jgi:hypothetical protein
MNITIISLTAILEYKGTRVPLPGEDIRFEEHGKSFTIRKVETIVSTGEDGVDTEKFVCFTK